VVFAKLVQPELLFGLFFLCALPSTVSSSIALTAAARGDVPSALFNATLSNLLGVFVTPLWVSLRLASAGQGLPLGNVVLDLVIWLLLPLFLGQVARRFIGGFVARHRRAVAAVDRGTILLLVYTSFCDSVKSSLWHGHGSSALFLSVGASVALLALMIASLSAGARLLGFSREERIAAIFCGSKKTLASGLPMARLMFGANPQLGLIVLPLLVYHPLQLVVCGWLAGRWGRES
jgi:sodium/bile acid cotransporter 7